MKIRHTIAGFAAVLSITGAATAQTAMKLGHIGEPGSLYSETADAFAACVNETMADAVKLDVFGSSQLGNDKELLQKLKLGQVDIMLPSSIMSSVTPEFALFDMPYLIQDRDHMIRVEEALGETFQEAVEAKGYHLIGWYENGFRQITNNVRPITVPDDLKGVKLRTPNGTWRVKMFQAYGANPTPMAFSDVFTALQTGVIDGQENPYAQIAAGKFYEVQKYLSITNHIYTPLYAMMSKRAFDGLDEATQTGLVDCAKSTQAAVYERAAAMETELLQVIKDAGVELNEADKEAFVAASQPIYDEFAAEVDGGADMIETVRGLVETN